MLTLEPKLFLTTCGSISVPAGNVRTIAPKLAMGAAEDHSRALGVGRGLWIVVTVVILGGVLGLLDYFGADDSLRTASLVLIATVTLVNAVWRAAGALGRAH